MKLLPLLFVAFSARVVAAPDEEMLGKSRGYPVCQLQQLGVDPGCLVGTLSRMDEVVPARKVAHGAPRVLKRADQAAGLGADAYMAANRNTGLLVLKGDTILAERYNYDRKPADRFQSYSMAKTVVAMLVGIAMDEGKISSIDDLAEKYVTELKGQPYGQTSLRHLLTMSSGVAFSEAYDGNDDVSVLARKTLFQQGPGGPQSVSSFTRRERAPGTRFAYASAETQVLSLVLRAAVGRNLSEYLSEKIWIPMGAEADALWLVDAGGHELGYMGLNATLRDWGRLGMLLAYDGALDGRQIIPADWVRAATRADAHHLQPGVATAGAGYGYQTWLIDRSGRFALLGVRGQAIMIDPASKFVVVHTAVHAKPRDPAARGPQFEFFFANLRNAVAE